MGPTAAAAPGGKLSDLMGGETGGLGDIMGGQTGGLKDLTGGATGGVGDIRGAATGGTSGITGEQASKRRELLCCAGCTSLGHTGWPTSAPTAHRLPIAGGDTGSIGDIRGGETGGLGGLTGEPERCNEGPIAHERWLLALLRPAAAPATLRPSAPSPQAVAWAVWVTLREGPLGG